MVAWPVGAWVAPDFEVVADIVELMPTGLTVADSGRLFVSFPRWGDDVPYTVAEIIDGRPVAYPDPEIYRLSPQRAGDTLVSVQSVIVDPVGYLWLLDTGSLAFAPPVEAGPKLVRVDLAADRVVRVIHPSARAVTPTTYLNDVRFDLSRGEDGYAYLADSQPEGALIVADLATGESWSRLRGHRSTHAEDGFRGDRGGRRPRGVRGRRRRHRTERGCTTARCRAGGCTASAPTLCATRAFQRPRSPPG